MNIEKIEAIYRLGKDCTLYHSKNETFRSNENCHSDFLELAEPIVYGLESFP